MDPQLVLVPLNLYGVPLGVCAGAYDTAWVPGVVHVVDPPIDPDIAANISSVVTCWLPAALHGAEPR